MSIQLLSSCFLLLLSFLLSASSPIPKAESETHQNCCSPSNSKLTVVEDQTLSSALEKVRSAFLSRRSFDRLDAVLLLQNSDDPSSWSRGMFQGDHVAYPASTVKLNYFVAAMHWCEERGLSYRCLDEHVRPMIVNSDNFETGIIVDTITNAPNIYNLTSVHDPQWSSWYAKRLYTENYLHGFEYVRNQVILSKTYPSNSAWPLVGAEKVLIDTYGKNQMNPCCASSLLLDVLTEATPLVPAGSLRYNWEILYKRRTYITFGYGLPVGSEIYSKTGLAYDTLEDISYVILPNGVTFLLSIYSNAFQRSWDEGALSQFVAMLLSELGWLQGIAQVELVSSVDMKSFQIVGEGWKKESTAVDKLGDWYFVGSSGNGSSYLEISFVVPVSGLYELMIYSPTVKDISSSTKLEISHQFGVEEATLNQIVSSRYAIVDNFNFEAWKEYSVKIHVGKSGVVVVGNGIKLTRWPYCDGVPGTTCKSDGRKE